MTWYNPWAEIRDLKFKLLEAEHTYAKLTKQIKELEFTKKENERELDLLESDLGELKGVLQRLQKRTDDLEKALVEASKNDIRDDKGRFRKAKN